MRREAEEFQTLLNYEKDRHLVGVKFLFTKEDYLACPVQQASHQMFFCMMAKAATTGHAMKVDKTHLYCGAAAAALGFETPDKDEISGRRLYERNLYGTEKAAADIGGNIPYLQHQVYGMCIQPLELYVQEQPDVVLSFCQPYTAMRIMQGYSFRYGFAKNLQFAGMGGVCTELMASAYQNQDISVSFLCSGTRLAGNWRDDELGVAFPYFMFLQILDGVRSTINTYEPDDKKKEIQDRAEKAGIFVELEFGKNYYGSSIGVARMGQTGYRPKKNKK